MQRAYFGLLQLGVHRKPTDGPLLRASAGAVKERLYVLLRGNWGPLSLSQATARLQFVYQQVAQAGYPALDVRVLLPGGGPDAPELEALLGPDGADDELATINEARASKGLGLLGFVRLSSEACAAAPPTEAVDASGTDYSRTAAAEPPRPCFEHVCLGGTFDYMHTGHKLLLSMGCTHARALQHVPCSMCPTACALHVPRMCSTLRLARTMHAPCARSTRACAAHAHALHVHVHCRALACGVNARLVVGVSDAPLLRKKVLRELMQPLPLRLALVADFVNSVAPNLRLELSPLQGLQAQDAPAYRSDPCGHLPLQRPVRSLRAVLWSLRGEPLPLGCRRKDCGGALVPAHTRRCRRL